MIQAHRKLYRQFYLCCLANLVLFFAMLTVDRLYIDDLGRSIHGDFGWTECGRPLADIVVYLVNLGGPVINIAPLPQIVSIALLASAAVALIRKYKINNVYIAALCTLPLAGQPYFLENMSYCFDSPTMALAVVFSVSAALQVGEPGMRNKLLATLYMLCTLMTYQAALSVYFVAVIYFALHEIDAGNDPWKYLVNKGAGILMPAVAACLLYLPIARGSLNPYAKELGKTIPPDNLWSGLQANVSRYVDILGNDWSGNAIGLLGATVIIGAFVPVGYSVIQSSGTRRNKMIYLLLLALSLPFILVASYVPQLLLVDPVFPPRTFIGIGAILSLSCLQLAAGSVKVSAAAAVRCRIVSLLPVCLLAYALTVFSYAFARANSAQKDYEHYVLTRLIADTDKVLQTQKISAIGIIGTIGSSPLARHSTGKFPLIGRLVPLHLNNNWPWGFVQLKTMGLSRYQATVTGVDREKTETATPVTATSLYKIFIIGDTLIIKFNNRR